ncbi:MAG: class I SAM-dependent methyltransferase [Candidatus Campbellbacteria bacterium]|nr:class I SAM-dependent methyltransferase [Candidatus Campbellbacteria bacterium]
MSQDSPMRSYLDSFVGTEIPRIFTPKSVSVLDIGCGTAYTRSLLALAGYSGVYTGVDIVQEPKFNLHAEPAFTTEFLNKDITTLHTNKKFDLVISNTSLEHIANDTAAVLKARELCADDGIEVHIVPSLWSLPLYLWHGYRQYTPARIRRLFNASQYVVYRMGGLGSFFLHFFCITIPERTLGVSVFRTRPAYKMLKIMANKVDRILPFCSGLYAVVVFHGQR